MGRLTRHVDASRTPRRLPALRPAPAERHPYTQAGPVTTIVVSPRSRRLRVPIPSPIPASAPHRRRRSCAGRHAAGIARPRRSGGSHSGAEQLRGLGARSPDIALHRGDRPWLSARRTPRRAVIAGRRRRPGAGRGRSGAHRSAAGLGEWDLYRLLPRRLDRRRPCHRGCLRLSRRPFRGGTSAGRHGKLDIPIGRWPDDRRPLAHAGGPSRLARQPHPVGDGGPADPRASIWRRSRPSLAAGGSRSTRDRHRHGSLPGPRVAIGPRRGSGGTGMDAIRGRDARRISWGPGSRRNVGARSPARVGARGRRSSPASSSASLLPA